MRYDRLPLTYGESRARFRRAAATAELAVTTHPITARGPDDLLLSVDEVVIGTRSPRRALVVFSGTHGVEGVIGSALQADLLGRLGAATLPDDVAVVLVHAVNPWGMAWWRRQNESNVDLNRNWGRDERDGAPNAHYEELHPLLCPDSDTLPDGDAFLAALAAFVDRYGLAAVRDAISGGQYSHPDGLYFGGERTEESTHIVERILTPLLDDTELTVLIDLHTGHGEYGTSTALCDAPPGSAQHRFWSQLVGEQRVECTLDNPDATTGHKDGQLGGGIATLAPNAEYHSTSFEFGTRSDTRQIVAGHAEHWVHRHGDRTVPEHAEVVWDHRCCYTPDDPAWERTAMEQGRDILDRSLRAVSS
ncbi:MAG: DUF2817 domain-containing protein [Acidimicrobiia bacterium]|nr:DUF2817 domain-containing protein [Acidimicrobiia bacterium]